jgi:GxxExxY protein
LSRAFSSRFIQNALIWELRKTGLQAEAERPISVYYDGQLVGAFTANLFVNNSLIVELKSIQALAKAHEVQLVNYLVATGVDEGLLLNFGTERLEFKKKFRAPKQEPVSL